VISDLWLDKISITDVTNNAPVTGVSVAPDPVVINVGQSWQLTKVLAPSYAANQNVTWSSNDTGIATVNSSGVVSAVAPGSATITVHTVDGNYTASTTIRIPGNGATVVDNAEFDSGINGWNLIDYTPIQTASMSVVTGAGLSGTNALKVDVTNDHNDAWKLQVWRYINLRLEVGKTYRVSFKAKAESIRALSVSLFGDVHTNNYGIDDFTLGTTVQTYSFDYQCNDAMVNDEPNFSIRFYLATGVVSDVWLDQISIEDITAVIAVTGVSVTPASIPLTVGYSTQLTRTITPAIATNQAVIWSSDHTNIASVNITGLVSAVAEGAATITVTTVDGNFTATSTITVTAPESIDSGSIFERFAFQYKYDSRKRMTHKKVPGADWVYMVYDERDRLVMTQDGNQRGKPTGEWTFIKYDALNRPVLNGIYLDAENLPLNEKTQARMQGVVDAYYIAAENNSDELFETRGLVVHGYSDNSFPKNVTENNYLTVTYYDDYSFIPSANADDWGYDEVQLPSSGSDPGQEEDEFPMVLGQKTGTKIKNLDTNEWLWSVNYYDDRYRLIQVVAQNNKDGLDKMTNIYDFAGKVLRTKTDHTINGSSPIATTREFSYDHAGRLLQTGHKTGNNPSVVIARNDYNELGQLITKNLHSTDGTTYKQQVDYRYNTRGWLTRINDSELSEMNGGPKDYFGMELGYESNFGLGTNPVQYNGNISVIKYSANQGLGLNDEELEIFEATERGYSFGYDPLNRLKEAKHMENTLAWAASASYHEDGLNYDMNGNIMTLNRNGEAGSMMDHLTYQYQGNRLVRVEDVGDDEKGFADGSSSAVDYIYDANGNMTTDENKHIALIEYNHLNLPSKVTKSNGEYLKYIYNAAGVKLSQEVYNSSNASQKKTEYLGELYYENDTLRFINHEEGRIIMADGSPEYQYMLKDHLGNNRLTFTTKPQTDTFTATLEPNTQAQEQSNFGSYNSITNDMLDHTDAGTANDKVHILNGGYNGQVGLAKSFAVGPGDVITAEVYAKYTGGTGPPSNVANFAVALTGAFGLVPTPAIDGPTAYQALNSLGTVLASGGRDDDDNAPKGFINILVFDKNNNLIDFAYQQIDANYVQNGGIKTSYAPLTVASSIRQAGYAYVFLSNEGASELQIGFDDYTVQHVHSAVVQQDDYYPFGLTFNSYSRENSVDQKYKFQGQEHIDDLDLGWDSFKWRNHQPDIGRFFNIDPLAEKYVYNSPYAFSENHVVAHRELEGLEKVLAIFYHGGPTGGGQTTTPAKAGTTGEIYNSTKSFAQSEGREFAGTVIAPGLTSASGVATGQEFVNANYSEGDQVMIYGYSYGVDNAMDLATNLGEQGVTVNTIVTVDGSDGPLQNSTVNTTVSDNVMNNLNVYQTSDSGSSSTSASTGATSSNSSSGSSSSNSGTSNFPGSNGGPNNATPGNQNKVIDNRNVTGPGVTHGNIQQKQQTPIQNHINDRIHNYYIPIKN